MWRDQLRGNLNCHSLKTCLLISVSLFVTVQFFIKKESECAEDLFASTSYENDKFSNEANCVMRKYSSSEAKSCFKKLKNEDLKNEKQILFVGSLQMISLFEDFVDQVGVVKKDTEWNIKSGKTQFPDIGLQVRYLHLEFPDSRFQDLLKMWQKEKPDLVVLNFLPPSSDQSMAGVSQWLDSVVNNVSDMAVDVDLLAEQRKIFWSISSYGSLGTSFKKYLTKVLKGTHVHVWDSEKGRRQFASNVGDSFEYEAQLILNYLCNSKETEKASTLCCSSYPTMLFEIKMVLVSCVLVGFGILLFFTLYHSWNSMQETLEDTYSRYCSQKRFLLLEDGSIKNAPSETLSFDVSEKKEKLPNVYFVLFAKCVVIFSYFYVCDRTNLFLKERKFFTFDKFFVPLLLSFVIGLAFREKTSKSTVLNREITDEWKGWMQIVLLIYHFTGASSHLHIYMYIRVLVTSYLFMTGFGNFCYYWNGGELSFRRYCQVMFRLNFLTVGLCLVMERRYISYYFVPLVSFWYTALFLLLRVPPQLTLNAEGKRSGTTSKDYVIVITKLLLFFALITGLSTSKVVFDGVFLLPVVRSLFALPGHADFEWWFRWHLDKFSIVYGAFFALIYMKMSQTDSSKEGTDKQSYLRTGVTVAIGVSLMFAYSSLFFFCGSKHDCNIIHPYISWIPIIGYILFRNASEEIRSSCSTVMLAAGKISLELFVGQYHIWLASDARGLLVLIPWGPPFANVILVSVVFVCVAHEVNSVTGELTALLFPKDNRIIIRNLVILFLGGSVFSIMLH